MGRSDSISVASRCQGIWWGLEKGGQTWEPWVYLGPQADGGRIVGIWLLVSVAFPSGATTGSIKPVLSL